MKSTWCVLAWPAPVQGAGQHPHPQVQHTSSSSQKGSSAGASLRHLTLSSWQPAAVMKLRLPIHPPLAITPTSHAGTPAAPSQAPALQVCRAGAAGGPAGIRQKLARTPDGYTAQQAIHKVQDALQSALH